MVLNNVDPSAYERVWIDAEVNNTDKKCIWSTSTPTQNCEYLQRFRNEMSKYKKDVGFVSHR